MAVTRRGFTPWQGSGKAWPVGTRAGDLAVLVRMGVGGWSRPTRELTESWRPVGRYIFNEYTMISVTSHVEAWVRTLAAADLAHDPPADYGQVTVLVGASGIGRVRTGWGVVNTQPGGGAFVVSDTQREDLTDLPSSGIDWQAPPGRLSLPRPWGQVTHRTAAGWAASPGGGWAGTWSLNLRSSMALELIPSPGPSAPVLLAPSDGAEVTASEQVGFEWQHLGVLEGGYQDAYRLRVDSGDGWRYWSASSGGLEVSEVTNASSMMAVAVPGSAFTPLVGYVAQVQTREGLDGAWSPWSPTAGFMTVTPPSVDLTGPAGSVVDDLTPTVTWASTTPRGVQEAYQVQILDSVSTAVLHDSHPRPGAASSYAVPVLDWTNGAGVTGRVRVQQTGGSWSLWAESAFTVSWAEPEAPVVVAVPGKRGVDVLVHVASEHLVSVERITTEGLWVPLISGVSVAPGAPLSFTDVFAPYGVPTAYRARAMSVLDGTWLRSGWASSEPVVSTDRDGCYLASADDPAGSWVRVWITDLPTVEHVERTALTYGLGDTHGRVTYGPEQGESGQMTLSTETVQDRADLLALLEAQAPLLLRRAAENDHLGGLDTGRVLTIARSSSVTEERVGMTLQARRVTFSWVEQPPAQVLDGSAYTGTPAPGTATDNGNGTVTVAAGTTTDNGNGTVTVAAGSDT